MVALVGLSVGSTIVMEGLHKRYGEIHAVRGLDLSIGAGEALGLLGPNGAGKTTTLHMLVGALKPDEGRVLIDGQADPTRPSVRASIGVAPQELSLYPDLSARENLRFFGQLHGVHGRRLRERVTWGLGFAGLEDRHKDRVDTFSGGMKRRLNLACSMLHEPKLLLCDEPTVGVDPQSRNHLFDCIEEIHAAGTTLVYTTHYMVEAERLCERVAIIDHGQVLALGTVEALVREHGGASLVHVELGQVPADPASLPGVFDEALRELTVQSETPFDLIEELRASALDIRGLRVVRPGLEQVFLALTGRSLRD